MNNKGFAPIAIIILVVVVGVVGYFVVINKPKPTDKSPTTNSTTQDNFRYEVVVPSHYADLLKSYRAQSTSVGMDTLYPSVIVYNDSAEFDNCEKSTGVLLKINGKPYCFLSETIRYDLGHEWGTKIARYVYITERDGKYIYITIVPAHSVRCDNVSSDLECKKLLDENEKNLLNMFEQQIVSTLRRYQQTPL